MGTQEVITETQIKQRLLDLEEQKLWSGSCRSAVLADQLSVTTRTIRNWVNFLKKTDV